MTDPTPTYLPYDVDVEQALLGAVLHDEAAFLKLQEASSLAAEDFYDPVHQRLYGTMLKRFSRGELATPLTLAAAMGPHDEGFREVGGKAYLISLERAAPALPNVVDYATILRDLAVRRRLITIGQQLVSYSSAKNDADDPSSTATTLADEASEAIYEASRGGLVLGRPEGLTDIANRVLDDAGIAIDHPNKARILTGLPCVDRALGGLFVSDLTVLAGAPSMGKSALAGTFCLNAARAGESCLLFSKEMTNKEFVLRHMAEIAGVSANRVTEGRITDHELRKLFDARDQLGNLPYKIDDSSHLTVAQMRARALAVKRRTDGNLKLIAIDHLRFIAPADPRAEERDQIQQITRDLKALGKEFSVAILLLAHLNRDFWKRSSQRPMMSDLYGASAIEQNADHVWFVHREEYYLERDPPPQNRQKEHDEWTRQLEAEKGWADVFSLKRRGGPTGKARLKFHAPLTRFSDPSTDDRQDGLDFMALARP